MRGTGEALVGRVTASSCRGTETSGRCPGPDGYRSMVPFSSGMTAPAATPSASEMAPAA